MRTPLWISAVLLAATSCSAPSLGVMPRYGELSINGHVGVASGGGPPQENSFESLGLEKDTSVPGARVDLEFGSPHLTLSWDRANFDGNGTVEADISQGGTTLPAGTPVATNVDLDLYSSLLTFDVIPGSMFEFGLGLGVQVADVHATLTGAPGEVDVNQTVPIPVLVARGGVQLGRFHLEGLFSGLKISTGGDDATFYDIDMSGRFRLIGGESHFNGSIAAGWRKVLLKAKYDDSGDRIDLDMGLTGPYLGLELSF